jgi:F-type H+-transporting ATPase subunit gamma
MAAGKEIRTKIKSRREHEEDHQGHGNGRGGQDAQGAGPHAHGASVQPTRWRYIDGHLSLANPEYKHALRGGQRRQEARGLVVVTTDKGLCGGLNTNMLRAVTAKLKEVQAGRQQAAGGGHRQQGSSAS